MTNESQAEKANRISAAFSDSFSDRKYGKLTFKQLQNWCGDRGVDLQRRYIYAYGNDERFFYWIPNKKYEETEFSSHDYTDKPDITVMWAILPSICFEIEDEVLLKDSPYKFKDSLIAKLRSDKYLK